MAKNLKIGPAKAAPQPAPQPPAPRVAPMPRSAVPLPDGVTGTPPMPEGRPVAAINPSSLSPAERAALDAVGWTPDVPIPAGMADIMADVVASKKREIAATPPPMPSGRLQPPARTAVGDLSATERTSVLSRMRQKSAEEADEIAREEAFQRENAARAAAGQPPRGRPEDEVAFTPRPQADAPQPEPAKPAFVPPEPARPSAPEPASSTGAAPPVTHCPHCEWDLSMPADPEPPHADRMAFLHCLLGNKMYSKDVAILGGALAMRFRTLTVGELDAVHRRVWVEQGAGAFGTVADYMERVNRYRLVLQLEAVRGDSPASVHADLPDGLSPQTNPNATGFWEKDGVEPGPDMLPHALEYVTAEVLRSESVFRVAMQACRDFNRTVSKLEAMVHDSDFWKPTARPS